MSESALLISTRKRVVWTKDEWKVLNRAANVFNSHGDKLQLKCGSPVCPSQQIELIADESDSRKRVLVCGCSVREFIRDV